MEGRTYLPAGTMLGGSYQIVRVVGAGGFGVTYEAEDVHLGTTIAIKEYFPDEFATRTQSLDIRPISERHDTTFAWGRSSFMQEARTLAKFKHPSVVRVLRVFEEYSTAYMVMEFESGPSFERWLAHLGRAPTQDELDRIVAPLLDALEMMHKENFLHRDIAPDNIILRADLTPILLDFGAARMTVAARTHVLTGMVKAGYSPQEQYTTDGKFQGPWTDFYALGGSLYRAVSGRVPDEAPSRALHDALAPARDVALGVYRATFLDGIDCCLRSRPTERPQNVTEARRILVHHAQVIPTQPISRPSAHPSGAHREVADQIQSEAEAGSEGRRAEPVGRKGIATELGFAPSGAEVSDVRVPESAKARIKHRKDGSSTPGRNWIGFAAAYAILAFPALLGSWSMLSHSILDPEWYRERIAVSTGAIILYPLLLCTYRGRRLATTEVILYWLGAVSTTPYGTWLLFDWLRWWPIVGILLGIAIGGSVGVFIAYLRRRDLLAVDAALLWIGFSGSATAAAISLFEDRRWAGLLESSSFTGCVVGAAVAFCSAVGLIAFGRKARTRGSLLLFFTGLTAHMALAILAFHARNP